MILVNFCQFENDRILYGFFYLSFQVIGLIVYTAMPLLSSQDNYEYT